MASSEVEKITEPVPIQEVEGVKSYLTPEVEAAVVNLAKSDEMQHLQHSISEGNNSSSIPVVPEGESFLESSSNGTKVSGQADEPIGAGTDQDSVIEDRVSPGIEAGKQISTPETEISVVQNEAAAPETYLENGTKDNGFSSGVEGKELVPEDEKEVTANDMATPVGSEVAEKEKTVVETGLLEEEKPGDSDDVKDEGVFLQEKKSAESEANETAESAEEAKITDDKPDGAVPVAAETVEKTLHEESQEEANELNEAAVETEKHIESDTRELGEPAVTESVTKTAESETDVDNQEQIHEPDSKEAPEIHDAGTSKQEEEVQTAEEASDAQKPELETKSNDEDDDDVKKEECPKENTTVADGNKIEEPAKEGTVEDLQIDDQSSSQEDIATPVMEKEVVEKENAEEIGVQEEEKAADCDDVRDKGVVLQEETSSATEGNETAESAEAKICDDKPDEAEHIVETLEAETVEKKPLHSESQEEASDQQNESPAEIEHIAETVETENVEKSIHSDSQGQATEQQNEAPAEIEKHIESESSKEEPTTGELFTKNGETDAEKQEEIVEPDSIEAPKIDHDAGTSKEEEEVQTKEEASVAQKTELETKSNDDDIVKEEEATPSIGVNEATEAPETTTVSGEDSTIHIVEKEVEVQKEEIFEEDTREEETLKEGTAEELKIDDQSATKETIEESEEGPEVTLQVFPEGSEEDEFQKKGEGESLEHAKDEKPSVETSEEADIVTLVASAEDDNKEDADVSNKDTTETVVESSPCVEDHESIDSTVQTSLEHEKGPEVTFQASPEGVEEDEFQKKEEVGSLEQAKDEKPSIETSDIVTPVEDKKEEAEVSNKDTTETVDESSPCIEATQDNESIDSTVQTSVEKEEGILESETLGLPVESTDSTKELEEVAEISNEETAKVAEEVGQLVIPVSIPEAEGISSSKVDDDDVAEEKTVIPKEDDKGDTIESPASDTIEHSNREVLEESETAAEVESSSTPHETEKNGEAVFNETAPLSSHGETPSGQADATTEAETSMEEQIEEPVKEGTVEDLGVDDECVSKEIEQNEKSPEAALETSPEGEKIEALPVEENEAEKGESKNEGIEEDEVPKKPEEAEIVERAIEVPLVNSEDAEVVQEGTGEHLIHETDQKPSVEASEDTDIAITPRASPEYGKKEEDEESHKESTEAVYEPATATQDHGSLESEAIAVEEVAEIISKEAPETAEVKEEAEGNSSSKVDDGVQEKVDMPEEESHATVSIEPSPVEDLQQDEQKVELSNEEVLEQSETAAEVESSTPHETEQDDEVVNGTASTIEAKTEVPETDEIIEKETSKGEEVESVLLQEEKEQETRTAAEENPEKPVTEHDITTEDDKATVVDKEMPEIIQPAEEAKELENPMEEKDEPTKEVPEEKVTGEEGEKDIVPEEKASVEPEAIETTQQEDLIEEVKESIPSLAESDKATDFNEETEGVASASIKDAPTSDKETLVEETTEDGNTMVEGTEKPLLASSATAPAEESEERSKNEIIEEAKSQEEPPAVIQAEDEHEEPCDSVSESVIPVAAILEAAAIQEDEVKGSAESEAISDQLSEDKHVVQSPEIPSQEDVYETKAVVEKTEEEKTKDVLVSQHDINEEPLEEVQTTEETLVQLSEPEVPQSSFEATTEDKVTEAEGVKEKELTETETEAEGESSSSQKGLVEKVEPANEVEMESLEAAPKEEVSVVDEKQEAPDSTLKAMSEGNDEVQEVQTLPKEPEALQDTPTQTEAECKVEEDTQELNVPQLEPEVEKEAQEKEIQEEVNAPAADITEEHREIPESVSNKDSGITAAVAENIPKETEEDEVKPPVADCKMETEVEKNDDEITTETKEICDGTAEDKPKQIEEEEAPALNATEEDVQESEKVQDDEAVATEETKEVSAFTTMAEAELKEEAAEANWPVEQVSREFQASDLENEVEKDSQESEGSAITEEIKEVSEVLPPVSGTQETKPLTENEISHPESLPVEKSEEVQPEASEISEPTHEDSKEAKEMEAEVSLIKEEPIVELGLQTEGQEEKEEAAELMSNFEFPGFAQPKELEQQVTTEWPTEKEESKETEETQEKTVDISTETKKETLKPEDSEVHGDQPEESTAEQVIKEKEIILETKPGSEEKAETIPEEEIEPKESQNEEVSHEKETNPSEGDLKIVEEPKAEATPVIDKELATDMSQRDLPMKLVEEETSEKQISTDEAIPAADNEAINPAKLSLFDMMAQSSRERNVVLDSAEEKKEPITGDETKPAEAEPEKAKSDGEKEHEEEGEGEDNHKNDSGSDGLVIVEASKEAEVVKVVTTPQKKSHNILSEVGSKVKHSISKVRKVITGKSSHQSKQSPPKEHSPK